VCREGVFLRIGWGGGVGENSTQNLSFNILPSARDRSKEQEYGAGVRRIIEEQD